MVERQAKLRWPSKPAKIERLSDHAKIAQVNESANINQPTRPTRKLAKTKPVAAFLSAPLAAFLSAPLAVLLLTGVCSPASAEEAAPVIQTIGEGEQRLFVVNLNGTWSMHAENLPTNQLFDLWEEAGGPTMVTKTLVDRPYTISVHGLSPERIVDRLLVGYGYTLHYDGQGRLDLVRVYSPVPSQLFKTPRLVESLGKWREAETPALPEPTATNAENF